MSDSTTNDSRMSIDPAVSSGAWLGGFEVKEETYPNGWIMLVVWRGKKRIGNCQAVTGGYLVNGKRKPVASLLLAAKQMIDDGMNKCRAEETTWRKMMTALKNECGSIPPNAEVSDRESGTRRGKDVTD